VLYVLVTRVVFYAIAYAAAWFLSSSQGPSTEGFFQMWGRWDAQHFLVVAEHGWSGPDALPARPAAFFPFYPLGIRALAAIGLDPILAGMLISTAATIVACAFLIRLADEEFGGGAGRRAALYLLLFPTAVFLAAPYSEALFLAGAIPAFYYARRGRWMMAALPLALATGSRAAGMFLLAGLAFEWLRQAIRDRRIDPGKARAAATALLLGSIPLIAYGLFLWKVRGTPWQYFTDQSEGWGRNFPTNPLTAFQATWNTRLGAYPTNWIFAWRIEILAAMAGVSLTIWAALKKEWGYAVYMGLFMVSLLMSSWYFSIPRMLLSFFPGILFLTEMTRARPDRHELALVVLAPIATLGVVVFTRGAWFY
jgi:Mannosyltransferase (PIG-V)